MLPPLVDPSYSEEDGKEAGEQLDADGEIIEYKDSATETGRQASSHQVSPGVRSSAAAAARTSQSSLYLVVMMLHLLHLVIRGCVAASSCNSIFIHYQQ